MTNTKSQHWGIEAEMEYLDGLGSWTAKYRTPSVGRKTLLENYIESTSVRRETWAAAAVKYARILLIKEFGEICQ